MEFRWGPIGLTFISLLLFHCSPKHKQNSALKVTSANGTSIPANLCSSDTIQQLCQFEDVQSQNGCLADRSWKLKQCVKKANEAKTAANNKVLDTLKNKFDPVVAQLSEEDRKAALQATKVRTVMDRYQPKVDAARTFFQATVSTFKLQYKDVGEKELTQALQAAIVRTQSTDRRVLLEVLNNLDKIAVDDSIKLQQLRQTVVDCESRINSLSYLIKEEIGDSAGFMQRNGIADMLDPFRDLKPVLQSILIYIDRRNQRVQEEVTRLRDEIDIKVERLRRIEVENETQESIAKGAYLTSVNQFYSEIEGVRTAAFRAGAVSVKTRLPRYADQYAGVLRFLSYGVYCKAVARPVWMDSGCLRFTNFEAQAITLLNTSLPKYVIQNLSLLASQGSPAPEALVSKVRELILAKKFEEGMALYDALLDMETAP